MGAGRRILHASRRTAKRHDAGSGRGWAGHFFRAFGDVDAARAITDEQLETHPTASLPPDTIPNLHWIIPLMLDDEPVAGRYAVHVVGGT